MDKKMTRKILYVSGKVQATEPIVPKKSVKAETEEPVVAGLDIAELVASEIAKSKKIVGWINSHPAFKWGIMCTALKMDRGNFQRTLKSADPKINVGYIAKIEDYLKKYGYAK